jgi:peptidyl-prolyl cis-trans isomerase D
VPESKVITYAILEPEMLIDEVEITDAILSKIYGEKKQEYNKPEERTIERLSFLTMADATAILSELKASATNFDKLVWTETFRMKTSFMELSQKTSYSKVMNKFLK